MHVLFIFNNLVLLSFHYYGIIVLNNTIIDDEDDDQLAWCNDCCVVSETCYASLFNYALSHMERGVCSYDFVHHQIEV